MYVCMCVCMYVCRVDHSNIVRLIEVFDSKRLYLVMEL